MRQSIFDLTELCFSVKLHICLWLVLNFFQPSPFLSRAIRDLSEPTNLNVAESHKINTSFVTTEGRKARANKTVDAIHDFSEPVLIHWLLIGFETILEGKLNFKCILFLEIFKNLT